MVGQVGDGTVWVKQSEGSEELRWVSGITDDVYPIEDQRAYEVTHATRDGEYRARDRLYAVSFEQYRKRPIAGDELIVEYELGGFKTLMLSLAVTSDTGVVLSPLHGPQDGLDPEAKRTIIGLVIGFYRPKRPA